MTVVIANRDYADLVGGAVASVYAQDHDRVRLVVVDDGSVDGSWDAIRAATRGARFPTSTIRLDRSKGQAAARNAAIGSAWEDTDVFALLDSDDRYLPSKVSSSLRWFAEGVSLVYTDELYEDRSTGRRFHGYREPFDFARLLRTDTVGGSYLVTKAALERVGRFDESMQVLESYDLALRAAAGSAAVHAADPLVEVRLDRRALRHAAPEPVWAAHAAYARSKPRAS